MSGISAGVWQQAVSFGPLSYYGRNRNIYEEQVTEMTNSVIAIEDETLRCYQAVGNVYESCWIHFSDITDVMLNKKKQAFLIQITEDQEAKK